MNGGQNPITVFGRVTEIDTSGIGPRSGGMTLVMMTDNGVTFESFANIMIPPDSLAPHDNDYLLEHPVFTAYVNLAIAAMITGRRIQCTSLNVGGRNHITGINLL